MKSLELSGREHCFVSGWICVMNEYLDIEQIRF